MAIKLFEKTYNNQTISIWSYEVASVEEDYTNSERTAYAIRAYGEASVTFDITRFFELEDPYIVREGGNNINPNGPWQRCLYFDEDETYGLCLKIYGNDQYNGLITRTLYNWLPDCGGNWAPSAGGNNKQCVFSTNIPIFENETEAYGYMHALDVYQRQALIRLKAVNYQDPNVEPDNEELEINNYGVLQVWTAEGKQDAHSTTLIYRCFKIKKTAGKISFYKIPGIDGDSLKYGIKYSSDFQAYYIGYSTDGGNTYTEVDELPYNFIYRNREDEIGRFYASPVDVKLDASNTGIPTWDSEQDADDYNAGTKDITDATNWSVISKAYPIMNGTEEGEESTEFGQTYMRSVFSQLYMMTSGGLSEVSNGLFDVSVSGVWDKIKKGIEMYGTDPMQCVQGLTYYPFDLSTMFTNFQNQQYVYFGGYELEMQNTVKKVLFPQGYKDLGTMTIKRTFNDWRDFEPYTKLSVYLPYVGVQPLDLARYYDKTVTVRYYVDIRTSVCMVVLIANGIMLDYFMGQMGVQMPITLTDFARYSANQINTILQGTTGAISAITPYCGSVARLTNAAYRTAYKTETENNEQLAQSNPFAPLAATGKHSGSAAMMAMNVAGQVGSSAVVGGASYMRTVFDLTRNGINGYNKTKGTATSLLNCYLPQYITFMFEIMEADESEYLNELAGRPTNVSGRLGDFSGYLECDDVMLICPIATDAERQEIIDLVKSGIYI